MKVETEESTSLNTSLSSVSFPGLRNSAMFTPSQLLMASQLMAASGLGIPTNPAAAAAFFHPGLFAWPTASPPSPPTAEQLSPALKARKHNNNNNVVSSSSQEHKKTATGTKRSHQVVKYEEEVPLSPPSSASSPPTSTGEASKDAGRDKQFTCGVCNRSFGYKHVLQNHERTHTGEKPFECPECHKRFTRDHHLKTHMRLHTGERPYHCDHCDRQFVQVANLRRHLRVHTGERPYSCELCSAKFSDSNQLKAHMLIHTNEKPFNCQRCKLRFRRRHHLLHHKCGAPACGVTACGMKELPDEDDEEKAKKMLRVPSAPLVTLPLRVTLPEQTEPEDLSMSTGLHSHSSGDSPLSRSPSSREDPDEDFEVDDSTALFLQKEGRHTAPSLLY